MRWQCVVVAGVAAGVAALAGCDDSTLDGPFGGLPLDGDFTVGLGAPAHVARDRYGVAHIYADTVGDAAFVQGYVTAHDRLPQMDILRREAAGKLAELYGGSDPTMIDSDLEMRMFQLAAAGMQTWKMLQTLRDPADQELVALLQRYADGVNQYWQDLEHGLWMLDPAIAFDPARFSPWTPPDSLMLYRFYALAQSWTVPFELDETELYDAARAGFDQAPSTPAITARRGLSRDLVRFAPVGRSSTIDGFPNVSFDTGSRSDGSAPGPVPPPPAIALANPARPQVPQALFDAAHALFGAALRHPPLDAPGAPDAPDIHALRQPVAGGNAWAVGSALSQGGPMLAADLELPLTDPSLFYPTHLMVTGRTGDNDPSPPPDLNDPASYVLDALGVTIPGIPGVMFGENGSLAWAGTASEHDVNDVYLESIAPCDHDAGDAGGTGDCAAWTDPQGIAHSAPIATISGEPLQIGTSGAIVSTEQPVYELVPQHGPILPVIDPTTHQLVPRTGPALSVRDTRAPVSFELRALYNLAHAHSVADGFRALGDITYGSQSMVLIDHDHIGWTTHAQLPVRAPAAYGWDPNLHQDQLAPFFVLPGTGGADWLDGDQLSPRFIPHAIDPAAGYLVASNGDPVGATFTGLPLSAGSAAGQPLYAGIAYAAGLRDDRITQLIAQHGGKLTLDDMAVIQRDTRSNAGAALTPAILAALGRLDRQPQGPPDVNPYLDALSPDDAMKLVIARSLFTGWTFATPTAIDAPDPDSAATALFNTWMHFFIERTLKDEFDAINFDVWRLGDDQLLRIVYGMLADPRSFVTSPGTQQPILCDNFAAAGPDDSCTKAILQAMVDAMTYLASTAPPQGFGTADTSAWRWGNLHRAQLAADKLPRPGDGSSVSRCDVGWANLDFTGRAGGQAIRFVAQAAPGAPIHTRWALPGGAIFDSRSPHAHDLLDGYYLSDALFDAAFSVDEIVAAGETRWVFH